MNLIVILLIGILVWLAEDKASFLWTNGLLDNYKIRILNLCAINVVLGLSLNLINGFTGQFSLGHAGFMAVGAYTSALLTMSPSTKVMNFFIVPLISPLDQINLPFLPALIAAGLAAALFGFVVGFPVLRLRGDYLAIASLGFAEVIRVVIMNAKPITNGSLGLKGVPLYTNLWWSVGWATVTLFFMIKLINSSYGRAFRAIREDEVAAEAMGVSLLNHKMLSFTLSAFIAGVGGALLGNLLGTVDPSMFTFMLTFNVLMIVVLGGLGSITGTVIGATIITVLTEVLRIVEQPMDLGFIQIPGILGMRMVFFSALLVMVIIYYQSGLMGTRELSWESIQRLYKKRTPAPQKGAL